MRICPKCRARYDASVRQCPTDGRRVVTLAAFAGGGGDALQLGVLLMMIFGIRVEERGN